MYFNFVYIYFYFYYCNLFVIIIILYLFIYLFILYDKIYSAGSLGTSAPPVDETWIEAGVID